MIDASKMPRVPTQLVPASEVKAIRHQGETSDHTAEADTVDMVLQDGRYYVVKQLK